MFKTMAMGASSVQDTASHSYIYNGLRPAFPIDCTSERNAQLAPSYAERSPAHPIIVDWEYRLTACLNECYLERRQPC